MAEQALGLLRLARTEGVGPVTYRRLLARFSSPDEALYALPALAKSGGRLAPLKIPSVGEIEREYNAVRNLGGHFLFLNRPAYPAFLAELPDAPSAIAVLGDLKLLNETGISVVGARNASANGMRLAAHLSADLAKSFTIISGLARGIDAAAHDGAMRTGRTIAVIAGGLDVPYPIEHKELQRRIAENGAVVAEAPLGTAPMGRHFPKRNRIIAGLCQGVVVIEAAVRSGSLLTARMATEAGREVFAVPGSPLDPRARGSNDLIRQGAHLTETAEDVFNNLPQYLSLRRVALDGFAEPTTLWEEGEAAEPDIQDAQKVILSLLSADPVRVDEIARRCQLSMAAIKAAILELELAGRLQSLTGDRMIISEDS